MKRFFLKHCVWYRRFVTRKFGKYKIKSLSIPSEIYSDFNVCYLGYDKHGNVLKGFSNIVEAIKNRGSLGLTVMYDYY